MTIICAEKMKRGDERQTNWGTVHWNTYGQVPRKCCEEEEISKRIESESQGVCRGCVAGMVGFLTLLSQDKNTAVNSTAKAS